MTPDYATLFKWFAQPVITSGYVTYIFLNFLYLIIGLTNCFVVDMEYKQ